MLAIITDITCHLDSVFPKDTENVNSGGNKKAKQNKETE